MKEMFMNSMLKFSLSNIYIYIYIYIQELPQNKKKTPVLLPIKSSSDDDPGFRHGFGAEASLLLTQGAPAVSHNTTRLYWMVFDLYECHIRSDAVTALFWIFFLHIPSSLPVKVRV